MALTIRTPNYTAECTCLKVTGAPVTVTGGVATVGTGTAYPVALGGPLMLTDGTTVWAPVGCLMWAQGQAYVELGTGLTHLGAGANGDATKMIPAASIVFDIGTLTDQKDGLLTIAF